MVLTIDLCLAIPDPSLALGFWRAVLNSILELLEGGLVLLQVECCLSAKHKQLLSLLCSVGAQEEESRYASAHTLSSSTPGSCPAQAGSPLLLR